VGLDRSGTRSTFSQQAENHGGPGAFFRRIGQPVQRRSVPQKQPGHFVLSLAEICPGDRDFLFDRFRTEKP